MIGRVFNRIRNYFNNPQSNLPEGVHAKSRVRLESVSFDGPADLGEGCIISGRVRIGRLTTIGHECMICGRRDTDALTIGSFCQLGPRVAIYASNHRTDLLTTYVGTLLFAGELKGR
jgi:UDP-3-O-[3-hydroxymyristoyl] glucosamine N-acyltransferase